jgi:hypothetical protein
LLTQSNSLSPKSTHRDGASRPTRADGRSDKGDRKRARDERADEERRIHRARQMDAFRQGGGASMSSVQDVSYDNLLRLNPDLYYQVYRMGQLREIDDLGVNILGLNSSLDHAYQDSPLYIALKRHVRERLRFFCKRPTWRRG